MSHEVRISDDGLYILMIVQGELTNELANQQMNDLYQLANAVGVKKFLIDLQNCRFVGSTVEQYEYTTTEMPKTGFVNRRDRFAFLVDPEDHSHDFVETVSRNNGYDVSLFRDRGQAIRYLLEE